MTLRIARLVAVVGLLLLPMGCTRVEETGSDSTHIDLITPTYVEPAMMDLWKDFPVTRRPRPIVGMDGVVAVGEFRTDDATVAFAMGLVQRDAPLPSGPPTMRVTLRDGTYSLPAITSEHAFTELLSGRGGVPPNGGIPPLLHITKITLGTAVFATDRGGLTLPAWLFETPESVTPLAVAALDRSVFWERAETDYGGANPRNTLAPDGVTLTVVMVALPMMEDCPGEPGIHYVVESIESSTAVGVGLRGQEAPYTPGVAYDECETRAATRPYTVRLAAPLGNRVVIGSDGRPFQINIV